MAINKSASCNLALETIFQIYGTSDNCATGIIGAVFKMTICKGDFLGSINKKSSVGKILKSAVVEFDLLTIYQIKIATVAKGAVFKTNTGCIFKNQFAVFGKTKICLDKMDISTSVGSGSV